MKRTRLAAWVCLIASLLFAGLILGRSLPLAARQPAPTRWPTGGLAWRPGTLREQRAVLAPVRGQMEALGRGDYAQAMHYFTPRLRELYGSPAALRKAVTANAPEFAHPRRVQFGMIWMNMAGRDAGVPVLVIGQDGREDGALFQLERGEGADGFHIAGIRREQRPPLPKLSAPALKARVTPPGLKK